MKPLPAKELLIEMRDAGMTRKEMAEKLGCSFSQIKRMIAVLEIERRPAKTARVVLKTHEREQSPRQEDPEAGKTLMEKAAVTLGRRLGEDHRGYLLDGRPASTDQILRAAGLELKNPRWSLPVRRTNHS